MSDEYDNDKVNAASAKTELEETYNPHSEVLLSLMERYGLSSLKIMPQVIAVAELYAKYRLDCEFKNGNSAMDSPDHDSGG